VNNQEGSFLGHRRAGILLHPTSLPGQSFGDLGPNAYRFVDFLVGSGISVWQTLPLTPTHDDDSPYNSLSAHAGNPQLISIDLLKKQGWLDQQYEDIEFGDHHEYRNACLKKTRDTFFRQASATDKKSFDDFVVQHDYWIDDYALYQALRVQFGTHWIDWPAAFRDRHVGFDDFSAGKAGVDSGKTEQDIEQQIKDEVQQALFEQFVFFEQWHALRQYANERGILLFGDVPIFVAHDSADVWANRGQFFLDEDGLPLVVAGVPPDYFSETGQRWGNPLYNWQLMQEEGYQWWVNRMRTQLELFDLVRIDHFRGFEAYWEIAAECETAMDGHWVKGPGEDLFRALEQRFGNLPVVAEDLGLITPEVTALREHHGFPGMKILQFAFDGDNENAYLPHNHESNSVVYTGTHDNDTTLGWFESLSEDQQNRVMEYLGHPDEPMPWSLIRAAFNSIAELAVVPMQDVLALGSADRMNIPGTTSETNWRWQFSWDQVEEGLPEKIRLMVEQSER
jgi:4-alpha-glucanotransferase